MKLKGTYNFDKDALSVAEFAKAISHPARLSILKFLAQSKTCISGDISEHLPLSRSTVFQHLQALKDLGLIQGNIEGVRVNYCLKYCQIKKYLDIMNIYFNDIIDEESLNRTC